jgi:hypothetical protein
MHQIEILDTIQAILAVVLFIGGVVGLVFLVKWIWKR